MPSGQGSPWLQRLRDLEWTRCRSWRAPHRAGEVGVEPPVQPRKRLSASDAARTRIAQSTRSVNWTGKSRDFN